MSGKVKVLSIKFIGIIGIAHSLNSKDFLMYVFFCISVSANNKNLNFYKNNQDKRKR